MSKLVQRITELRKTRGEKVAAYETLITAALDANRDLTEEEGKTRETLKSELAKLDAELDRLEADERALAIRAVPLTPAPASPTVPATPHGIVRNDRGKIIRTGIPVIDEFPGAGFVRMAIAVAVAGEVHAAAYAEQRWGSKDFADILREYSFRTKVGDGLLLRAVTPPMNSGEAVGSGGSTTLIIVQQLAAEFIEMLRPALIVNRLPGMRHINFAGAGTLRIPRQTGGVTGAYIGEGNSIIVQRLNFDQVVLTPSKLAVITATTNELLRRSEPSIEALIRDDMIEGTARTIDKAFIASAPAAPAPNGILTYSAVLAAGAIPAAATTAQVTDALRAMITAMRMANVPMTSPAWLMSPRTKEYIRLLRAATVEVFPFKDEINGGTLLGYPIIDSTNVPIAGDTSVPYALIDCSQIIMADDMAPVIDASEEATIQSDSAPATPPAAPYTSAFQQDMTFLRIRMSHSWSVRHPEAIVWASSLV